mmetsp:Transcript_15556/g.39614  ORF Transcript_15556/g.39614 Transcript_15556/m.39614 type:complete len:216 (-) Transcript_15556:348-995(-)
MDWYALSSSMLLIHPTFSINACMSDVLESMLHSLVAGCHCSLAASDKEVVPASALMCGRSSLALSIATAASLADRPLRSESMAVFFISVFRNRSIECRCTFCTFILSPLMKSSGADVIDRPYVFCRSFTSFLRAEDTLILERLAARAGKLPVMSCIAAMGLRASQILCVACKPIESSCHARSLKSVPWVSVSFCLNTSLNLINSLLVVSFARIRS